MMQVLCSTKVPPEITECKIQIKIILEGRLSFTNIYWNKKSELRRNLEEECWEQERPKCKDPGNEDCQAPCQSCVEVDVVPAIEW